MTRIQQFAMLQLFKSCDLAVNVDGRAYFSGENITWTVTNIDVDNARLLIDLRLIENPSGDKTIGSVDISAVAVIKVEDGYAWIELEGDGFGAYRPTNKSTDLSRDIYESKFRESAPVPDDLFSN